MSYPIAFHPVSFRGQPLLYAQGEDGCAELVPLHHIDANGDLTDVAIDELAFAVVYPDGGIWRFRQCIGTVDDLVCR